MSDSYKEVYARSLQYPEQFWAEAAEDIHWHKRWRQVLEVNNPPFYRWYTGGQVNVCFNAVDRHVEDGRGDQLAIIYDSPVSETNQKISYKELQQTVAVFAGGMAKLGVGKGDTVIIYMPMVPEAIIAMLACARLGAVHAVVFGGFAANELASRIDDAKPKLLISASCGIEPSGVIAYKPLLDKAIELANFKPEKCIILQRSECLANLQSDRDVDWQDSISQVQPAAVVPVASTDPLYILYTSGTTGIPKGVVRDSGGYMVALKWSMKNVYNINPGDVFWAASDIGWVVGHSYIVYAPLLQGCTTILFEGKPVGTPDAGVFWRVISEHNVNALFTAPTALRAIKREDPEGQLIYNYNLSSLKTLFLAGERADTDTIKWAEKTLDIPVVDHWWQTETGWPICANCTGIESVPIKYGSPSVPVPGWDIQVLNADGNKAENGIMGDLVIKLPLPPGSLPTLWGNDERYVSSYLSSHAGYYLTGDAGYMDEDGYVFVMSRTDDIINVAGHRLSTGGIEEVITSHPDVAECAVIGIRDELKGQLPMGFAVLYAGTSNNHNITAEIIQLVRDSIGPVASFKKVLIVNRLPKTRSGKILRATMKKIADGEEYKLPATIDDPAILKEIENVLTYPS
jgi:propionyl-CoA synthetase